MSLLRRLVLLQYVSSTWNVPLLRRNSPQEMKTLYCYIGLDCSWLQWEFGSTPNICHASNMFLFHKLFEDAVLLPTLFPSKPPALTASYSPGSQPLARNLCHMQGVRDRLSDLAVIVSGRK